MIDCELCSGSGWIRVGDSARPCECRAELIRRAEAAANARPKRARTSRAIGADGERELVEWLHAQGIPARRGVQREGGLETPDVVTGLPFHVECKRTERRAVARALEQATHDAEGRPAVVFQRSGSAPWVVFMTAVDFFALLELAAARPLFFRRRDGGTGAQLGPRNREIQR